MKCKFCNAENIEGSKVCSECGREFSSSFQTQSSQPQRVTNVSPCNKWVAFFLCLLLGGLGIHRFYVGKIGTAILYIFTLGGFFGIGALIDLIMIACGRFTDKSGAFLLS